MQTEKIMREADPPDAFPQSNIHLGRQRGAYFLQYGLFLINELNFTELI